MKVYLDSVGCRLNQSEIEAYARQFRMAGHTLVDSADKADLAVVNTCTVTAAASSDSRQKVRQIQRAGVAQIVVTGCWSTLDPVSAAKLPGVTQVIPNAEKDQLASKILNLPVETFDLEPIARQPLPGARLRTRAFIKAQDGCNNRCTYCITSIARGPAHSRGLKSILKDIIAAQQGGTQEIVLTGVHLAWWGRDMTKPKGIKDLVQHILAETDMPRIRFSSLEPWDLDDTFFELWANPRVCRHLHLPLQSGSADTLRRMARNCSPQSYASLVNAARKACPEIAITTDLIAGFPGEDEHEFDDSLAFVRQMDFAGGHVFSYSARPGTMAASLPNQIPLTVRKERSAALRELLGETSQRYKHQFVGQTLPVLWEGVTPNEMNSWQLSGLTDNYLRVNAISPQSLWNQISLVKVEGCTSEKLLGQIVVPPD